MQLCSLFFKCDVDKLEMSHGEKHPGDVLTEKFSLLRCLAQQYQEKRKKRRFIDNINIVFHVALPGTSSL